MGNHSSFCSLQQLTLACASRNPYHILCNRNNCHLLQHLIEKLPSDVNEALFKQQTRGQSHYTLLSKQVPSRRLNYFLLARMSQMRFATLMDVFRSTLRSAVASPASWSY